MHFSREFEFRNESLHNDNRPVRIGKELAPALGCERLVLEDCKSLTCAWCVWVEDFFNLKTKVCIWVHCWACKCTISSKFFLLDAADERNLINLGMHFQANLPNFEGPQWFYFVLGPCVKYRSSISSTSSLLTTPNELSILSRKRDRLSTVQIKRGMGFVLFLILAGRLRHFQRRGVGDSCIAQASSPSLARHKLGLSNLFNATLMQVMFAEVLEHLQCAASPWGEHSVHPVNHTAGLRNSDSRVSYLDVLTRLPFCATHPSQGCSPVSSCTPSMLGLEWRTSREEVVLEEGGLVTQWVAFFPLSQCWTKYPHVVLRGAVLL